MYRVSHDERLVVHQGSFVTVEVYLSRIGKSHGPGAKQVDWIRHTKDGNLNYTETYEIGGYCVPRDAPIWQISYDSFIGRALLNRSVGDEVLVNVGGLSTGPPSGNHLKFVIVSIR